MTNAFSTKLSLGLTDTVSNATSYIIQIERYLDDTDGGDSYSNSDRHNNEEFEEDSISILDKMGAVLWLLLLALIFYKMNLNQQQRIASEEQERSRQRDTSRREWKLEPARREMIINITTMRKRRGTIDITYGDNEDAGSSDEQDRERASIGKSGGDEQHGTVEGYSALSCPICLNVFERDDVITWSKELRCQHAYHADCLNPWLMKNDDCPICRTNLILEDDYDATDRKDGRKPVGEEENFEKEFEIANGLVSYVKKNIRYSNGKKFKLTQEEDSEYVNATVEKESDEINSIEETTYRKSFWRQSKKFYASLNTDVDEDGGDLVTGDSMMTNTTPDKEKVANSD